MLRIQSQLHTHTIKKVKRRKNEEIQKSLRVCLSVCLAVRYVEMKEEMVFFYSMSLFAGFYLNLVVAFEIK